MYLEWSLPKPEILDRILSSVDSLNIFLQINRCVQMEERENGPIEKVIQKVSNIKLDFSDIDRPY